MRTSRPICLLIVFRLQPASIIRSREGKKTFLNEVETALKRAGLG